MLRVARVVPLKPGTDIRGEVLGTVPCAMTWPDGVHAMHHCQYMLIRYAPVPPMKDGWVEEVHEGVHRCTCGMERAE